MKRHIVLVAPNIPFTQALTRKLTALKFSVGRSSTVPQFSGYYFRPEAIYFLRADLNDIQSFNAIARFAKKGVRVVAVGVGNYELVSKRALETGAKLCIRNGSLNFDALEKFLHEEGTLEPGKVVNVFSRALPSKIVPIYVREVKAE